MKFALLVLLLTLSGCAVCQRHPTSCAIGALVVAKSLQASTNHSPQPTHDVTTQPVSCAGGSCR